MLGRALKSNVIISIVALLFIAMLLIDFVVVRTYQRLTIQKEIQQASLLVSFIESHLDDQDDISIFPLSPVLRESIFPLLDQADIACLHMQSLDNRTILSWQETCGPKSKLEENAVRASEADKRIIVFEGSVWGVFWWQRQNVILSAPLKVSGKRIGGISIAKNLEDLYHDLRNSQRFVFIYFFINIVVLTFVGFHRLFKIFLEPIERLARRAENYQDNDETFFPVRKQDNELQVLSKSLNSMTRRITEDKKKLETAVHSLKQSNIELKKAQEEIIRAEKLASVGRLSSGIAHEIGNPIGIIMGYLELLKQESIGDVERQDFIMRTEKELHRMDTVIRQLLDISRTSSVQNEYISVHEIIEDIGKVLNVQPLMSNVELSLVLNAEQDHVMADPNQLRQVFLNLAINAADAIASSNTEDVGRLQIQTIVSASRMAEPHLEVSFSDNGPGISDKILDNIFDPFFTTKEPGKGTGLGLYVCFNIIDSLGGSMQARNQDGGGAEMLITLPLA